jgi:hypothetical protein
MNQIYPNIKRYRSHNLLAEVVVYIFGIFFNRLHCSERLNKCDHFLSSLETLLLVIHHHHPANGSHEKRQNFAEHCCQQKKKSLTIPKRVT